ncbi:MAG: pro-sigmaK processing inhibitor BofA family protein [Clostridiales bacterium]|jgi:inhibitor of the pro-sigma K processing machinery|nr:pro-sigmaK processing inhibitor BofA family protein [Eubacteriales bacterium]MDH7567102.1 pro-sigmaK processing inhibitor BofA family protein [Clostridiales bacterium]
MGIDIKVVLAYIVGILLFFITGRLLLVPMKMLMKLIYNTILGGIALIAINLAGSLFQFHIAFNIVTALTAGVLGIPGIVMLVILKFVFSV